MIKKHLISSRPLTLCIVNYNGERFLEETLESAINQGEEFKEILLIDNASEDESLKIVEDRFPQVSVIRLEQNLGPVVARNAGYRAAVSDLILFIDNDVTLTQECARRLVEAIEQHPRAALAMPRILFAHDKHIIQYDGADCHFLGLMSLHNENSPLNSATSETKKIGSIVTACFLIDRSRWGLSDPFDETFFIYFDDHDFGMRARLFGHEILAVTSACCYHREGTKGLSLRATGSYSPMRVYCLIRNRWQILLKNYNLRTLVVLSPILLMYEILQFFGIIKKGWIKEWFKSVCWLLTNLADLHRRRRIVQTSRKALDRDLLRSGPIPFSNKLSQTAAETSVIKALNALSSAYWNLALPLL